MNNSTYRRKYAVMVDELIGLNVCCRPPLSTGVPITSYCKDHTTVRVNIGRQMGTSTYLAGSLNENSVVVVNSELDLEKFIGSYVKLYPTHCFSAEKLNPDAVNDKLTLGDIYDVYVDSTIPAVRLHSIYDTFCSDGRVRSFVLM